jgi:hypothetical protein
MISGLVTLLLTMATIAYPTPVSPLQPALQSYWLIIHVSIAVASSAIRGGVGDRGHGQQQRDQARDHHAHEAQIATDQHDEVAPPSAARQRALPSC